MADFDKTKIDIRYYSDEWGVYSFNFSPGLPTGSTLATPIYVQGWIGNVGPTSTLASETMVENLIDPEFTIATYDGPTNVILKLQYPFIIGDALPSNITAITLANPGVVSSVAHTKATGDIIYFDGLSEMTELNEAIRFITAVGGVDEFTIDDTSRYTAAEVTGGACGWSAEGYKGEKVTLIFKLNLNGGGSHPFYFQYVNIR